MADDVEKAKACLEEFAQQLRRQVELSARQGQRIPVRLPDTKEDDKKWSVKADPLVESELRQWQFTYDPTTPISSRLAEYFADAIERYLDDNVESMDAALGLCRGPGNPTGSRHSGVKIATAVLEIMYPELKDKDLGIVEAKATELLLKRKRGSTKQWVAAENVAQQFGDISRKTVEDIYAAHKDQALKIILTRCWVMLS